MIRVGIVIVNELYINASVVLVIMIKHHDYIGVIKFYI